MRLLILVCFAIGATLEPAFAAFVIPQMGGAQVTQGLAPMKHADISFSNNTIHVQVDETVGIPALRPLVAPDQFDPALSWSVLGTKAYNFQYGWNPSGFIIIPQDAWIWIEQLSATPGLEIYQRPPASPAYDPVFGTEGSSARWRWSGSMTHNVYAIQDPTLSLYEANYRIYIGDNTTGVPLPAYTPAEVTFQFAAIPTLLADFDADGDVDAQDLLQWEGDFGVNGDSDADGDGDSDGADFLAWQREISNNPAPATAAAAIPEPTSAILLLSAIICTAGSIRRRRR